MHFFGSNRFKPRRNFATINDDKQRRRRTRRRRKRVVVDVVVAVVVVAAPVVNKKAFLCLLPKQIYPDFSRFPLHLLILALPDGPIL